MIISLCNYHGNKGKWDIYPRYVHTISGYCPHLDSTSDSCNNQDIVLAMGYRRLGLLNARTYKSER